MIVTTFATAAISRSLRRLWGGGANGSGSGSRPECDDVVANRVYHPDVHLDDLEPRELLGFALILRVRGHGFGCRVLESLLADPCVVLVRRHLPLPSVPRGRQDRTPE